MPSPIRVLHVDDEPDFGDLTATFLEREDDRFTVETATSASEGLDLLAEGSVDCVVSDYDMPGMDGISFLEAVRADDSDLPFILFTGKGSEEVASDAISAGVTDYLQKAPGGEQYELLANRIENAVAQHRAERRATKQERILGLLRDLNRSLVQATTRGEIEEAVTDILAAADPYRFVWIGEYDAEWDRIVPDTAAGLDDGSVTPTELPEATTGDSIVLEAVRTGELAVTHRPDPSLAVWPDDASPVEYGAAAVVPIVYHGDQYGVLTLYAGQAAAFDESEREMLDELAGDIAQAIHTAETHRILERHRTAVETVPEGVFILDEDATIELANESAAALLGREPEAVQGEPFPTFVEEGIFDTAIIDWYIDVVRELLSSGSDREEAWYETDIQLPDGDSRTVEIHLTLRPYDEDYRGTVGVIRDITDQKERKRELEENKERYRRLVENAPVPIVLYGEDGDFRYVNDAAVAFVGAEDRDALLGQSAIEFANPEDRERVAARMRRVLEDREPAPATELSLVDQAGNRKEAIAASVPVTYENEPAAQVVLEDITEQKERERALQRQNERLEEFASIVSHDLRTPLNTAIGNLQLARNEGDSEYLDEVARAHDQMETLIEDLLTFARTGRRALDREAVDLADLAETCWRDVATAEATLVTTVERPIEADRDHLLQLVENLLRNAVEHGGEGVTVRTGELDDGFYVADDGPGIPAAERGKVFERGYSTAQDGTGFGLAIVRQIVEAHGWEISVTESDDDGARFEITGVEFAG